MPTPSKPPITSTPPPPPRSGGGLKYLLIGLLFLIGAGVLWFVARNQDQAAGPAPAPPKEVERVNPMKEPELELEEPAPDEPVAEEPEETKPKPGGARKAVAEWDCSGDLPGASKVVNENRPQIRSCYERRLKVNNVLQGALTLKLRVGTTGKVTATQVAGSLRDQEVFTCVRKLAQTWTFPVPTGGGCAVVEVPFQFSPKP